MSSLPRVAGSTWERVARDFDDRGPEACLIEIIFDLEADNPELFDMAARCARDVGDFARIMTGFCMFYRLLTEEARAAHGTSSRHRGNSSTITLLPRVSAVTRADIVKRIDAVGSQEFTREAIAELELNNPELLLMAHNFAADQHDYLGIMEGFALLFACLSAEYAQERGVLH
jgi:hypothetical protein